MRLTQTNPPETLNPFPWRRFANVFMGDHLLGEDTVDLASLGFSGDSVTFACSACGQVLGQIPVELLSDGLDDITTTHITPVLDWHSAKHRPHTPQPQKPKEQKAMSSAMTTNPTDAFAEVA
jgi:hypothetical protein